MILRLPLSLNHAGFEANLFESGSKGMRRLISSFYAAVGFLLGVGNGTWSWPAYDGMTASNLFCASRVVR
jgi:hypothetical protein